ncbi:MAG TPA: TonB-dependent receptor, partial [Candidatus Nitrosotenuis sp.]|nr:TonB-dependent receptor [Candidatus Nitrosotenuis sp.]
DSLHKKLGDAFSGPPYETQERFNAFRQFKKFSARYEGLDLAKWLPRLSVNYYHQKLSFPQSQYEYIINSGSSFTGNTFTGNPSTFTIRTFTDNKNTVTSDGIDGQVNLQPITGLIVTLGGGTLIDSSKDEFNRYFVDPTSPTRAALPNTPSTPAIFGGASAPNTRYTDNNFYALGDLDRFRLFRISLSLRVDNWRTKASPSQSFPLGSEFAVLNAAIPALQANPNPLQSQLDALPKLTQLAGRTGNVTTSNFSYTGGIGVVFRLPFGVNPYFKFSNSYREGSLTERYLIRNFPAFPGLVAIVVGNPNIKPEKGKNYEAGIKVQNNFFQGSLGYFRNDLTDLIRFQTPDVGNLCVAANPSAGLLPLNAIFAPLAGCAVGQSAISFNGRSNLSSATISGFEGTAEASIPLNGLGSINPFLSFGTLSGTNKSPNALQIRIINELYNRGDTPLKLKGTILDVPLGNITPLRMIGGLNFSDTKGRFYAEYSFRYQSRVERADPSSFVGTTLINYGTFASLNSIFKQTIKGGYAWKNDKYRFSINAGIDNLTDRLYWEHFQNAPATGRSFIIGFTTEFFNLLGNK